ncbi:Aste57867_20758 [Aphanomyces stellatus]|uniref:Aste57867_20758 protein n=1 Tax=Aphanomyces stellatus TaxID=120398 RepID=A0A485LGC9_9STRA|nr:hypothetical protein As57867_020690 [Aphanomyces stellatus]VFT97437.1 Aste57867_20758 [Aphanomyces stellatus]
MPAVAAANVVAPNQQASVPRIRLRHRVEAWASQRNNKPVQDVDDVTTHDDKPQKQRPPPRWDDATAFVFSDLHEACRVGDHASVDAILTNQSTSTPTLCTTNEGHTPLHVAVMHGHVACIERLLGQDDAALQMHAQDHIGRTPLHLAYARRTLRDACLPVLMQHATLTLCCTVSDNTGQCIRDLDMHLIGDLYDATIHGNVPRMQFLQTMFGCKWDDPMSELGRTLLHEASQHRQGHVITYLLGLCTPPWLLLQDSSGATALHVCAKQGYVDGCVLLLDARETATSLLLTQDNTGRTALHWSVLRGYEPMVTSLLEHATTHACVAALVGTCDDDGASPLHVAAATNSVVMAQKLVDAGADVNLESMLTRYQARRGRPGQQKAKPPRMTARRAQMMDHAPTLADRFRVIELQPVTSLPPPPPLSIGEPVQRRTIPTPLELALRGHCADTAAFVLEHGATITLVQDVWRLYLTAPTGLRTVLAPSARQWLDPAIASFDTFATICLDRTFTEDSLCSLVTLAIESLGSSIPWAADLPVVAFHAFQAERYALASLLKPLAWDGTPWPRPPSPHVSWLCAAATRGSLRSIQWLYDQQYEPTDADGTVFECILQPIPGSKGSASHKHERKQRTQVFDWLHAARFYHASTLPLHAQRTVDVALRHGYVELARTCLTFSNIDTIDAADALAQDHTFLLLATLPPTWVNVDKALTLFCQRNLWCMDLLQALIGHGAQPTPHALVHGLPAATWAVTHGRVDILIALARLDLSCLLQRSVHNQDALYWAARGNHVAIVDLLWPYIASGLNVTAAAIAAVECDALEALKWMAKRDPSIRTIQTDDGDALVHIACRRGYLALAKWLVPTAKWTSIRNAQGETPRQLMMQSCRNATW